VRRLPHAGVPEIVSRRTQAAQLVQLEKFRELSAFRLALAAGEQCSRLSLQCLFTNIPNQAFASRSLWVEGMGR
jgi:hypothetical protein